MPQPIAVLYDGTCGPCTRMARWAKSRAVRGRLDVVHSQAPGVRERYGVSAAEADRSVWVVEPDGTRWSGAAAVNRVLAELGSLERLLTVAFQVPALARAEERFYYWFAAHRPWFARFGVTPPCAEPGADCR